MKRFARVGSLLLAVGALALSGSAHADPIVFDNANWYEFIFGGVGSFATEGTGSSPSSGGNSEYAPDPAWTFTAPSGGILTITDAFSRGDAFEVFDFGVSMGTTPLVVSSGFSTDDPAVAVLDPTYSSAAFVLAPGAHSITIQMTASPFSGGAAYFRTDAAAAVPEPGSVAMLIGMGLSGIGLLAKRRRK